MSDRTYPYTAWVLTPSYNVKQIEVTKCYGYPHREHDVSSTGKLYHISDLYKSRGDAIRAGFDRCDAQQVDLRKRQERLDKRFGALEKANDAS
jgi:hypothetical protein